MTIKNQSRINRLLMYLVLIGIAFSILADSYFLITDISRTLGSAGPGNKDLFSKIFFKSFIYYGGTIIIYLFQRKNYFELNNSFYYIINLFVFASIILGELFDFYYAFQYWDVILHSLSGVLATYFGIRLFKKFEPQVKTWFVYFFAICFSAFIALTWELFEFFNDIILGFNMQKGIILSHPINEIYNQIQSFDSFSDLKEFTVNAYDKLVPLVHHGTRIITPDLIDSMTDMLVALIGSLIFLIIYHQIIKYLDKKGMNK